MQRIFPTEGPGRSVTVREAYDVARTRHRHRPWVGICMVAGLDGSTVVDSRSAGLSNPVDTEVLVTLRSLAQVLIVGAATVRVEGYKKPRGDTRVGVVTRTAHVDTSTPLFTSGAGFLIVPDDAPDVPVDAIRAGRGDVDLAAALGQIDADFVQCEGGATLNAAMFEADVVDELNLTISPQITGGDGPRLTSGAADLRMPMRLAHVLEDDGFLFTRYVRSR
jgi:riboflavin biosynthesis pyrimidine reductase